MFVFSSPRHDVGRTRLIRAHTRTKISKSREETVVVHCPTVANAISITSVSYKAPLVHPCWIGIEVISEGTQDRDLLLSHTPHKSKINLCNWVAIAGGGQQCGDKNVNLVIAMALAS